MTIDKLTALAKGDIANSTGADVATAVNSLIDATAVSVKTFGAVGDGVTDDTTALTNAHATGKSIFYPAGVYKITNTNVLEMFDGCDYISDKAEIVVDAAATISDAVGDGFGIYENSIFHRSGTDGLTKGIDVSGFKFTCNIAKVNAIGGGVVSDRDLNTAFIKVRDCHYKSIGAASGLSAAALNYTTIGSLVNLDRYSVLVEYCKIENCGQGINCQNSKNAIIRSNSIRFAGVSSDFTNWQNCAAIRTVGSEYQEIISNHSYFTGGTTFYTTDNGGGTVKEVMIRNNVMNACGSGGIASGIRTFLAGAHSINTVDIRDNIIRGIMVGHDSDLHYGIKTESTGLSTHHINEVIVENNYIDYLAEHETFDFAIGDVNGSYNNNKTKGNDTGTSFGVLVSGHASNKIEYVSCRGNNIRNHQRIGLQTSGIEVADVDNIIYNCGWSKDVSNNAYQLQQSFYTENIGKLNSKCEIDRQSWLVNANNSFCTGIKAIDIGEMSLHLTMENSGAQLYPMRWVANTSDLILDIHKLTSDVSALSGGYKYYIDLSGGGAGSSDSIITYHQESEPNFISTSGTMPVGAEKIRQVYTSAVSRTVTLLKSKMHNGSSIVFDASVAQLTITPATGETIDGVAGNLVVAVGTEVTIYSDGTEWFKV